ncbi:hypothetical protein NRK68_03285 [Streptomyces yangpuensis]|uniref:Nuclear transport factor 2 family protein n=1 Tax=Streptomyces yangpuensis TaxID=1648182 RepID=A0ABY5PS93_9ACTN|nr:hypothetical protein [Streptomyces yangpuensis]UUY46325.1 hypothetical protein NRK68_03285 [Streptomyces yangpuensis]
MMLKSYGLGALLLALPALPFMPPAPAPAPVPAVPVPVTTPAATSEGHTADQIGRFLTRFYGAHGPSDHDRRHHISQVLQDRQLRTAESDVLLCARNEPRDIGVGPVTVAQAAGVGWATVTTHWDSGKTDTFTVYVRLDSKPIRIDDVICAG